jgi:hypothetical protein
MRDLKKEAEAICGQIGWGPLQENGRTFVYRTLCAEADLATAQEEIKELARRVIALEGKAVSA